MDLARGFAHHFGETSDDKNATQKEYGEQQGRRVVVASVSAMVCHPPCSEACIPLKGDAGSRRRGSRVSGLGQATRRQDLN
jgi:hypothetical protein